VSPPLDFSTFYPVLVQGKAAEMRLDTESIHLSRTQHLTGQETQSLITMTTVSVLLLWQQSRITLQHCTTHTSTNQL